MKKIRGKVFAFCLSVVLIILSIPLFASGSSKYETSGMEFMDETQAGKDRYNSVKGDLPAKPGGGIPDQVWR